MTCRRSPQAGDKIAFGAIATQCLARLGSPIAGSRDLSALNEEDFHGARETQRRLDNPKPANRREQQQGMTDLRNCVEKAMKGAEVRADLTQPPGCTSGLAK